MRCVNKWINVRYVCLTELGRQHLNRLVADFAINQLR